MLCWFWMLSLSGLSPSSLLSRLYSPTLHFVVAEGSPSRLPSAVLDRVTDEVPVPPDASTVFAAEAEMARDAIMQIARMRDTIFLVFFIVMTPLIKISVEL